MSNEFKVAIKWGVRVATLSLYFLMIFNSAYAQESFTAADGWQLIEQCVTPPSHTTPREAWTFDGVIFSSSQEGVRAIRTDLDTSYFIAFYSYETFAQVGSFSPDDRWFAYPVGGTDFDVNGIGDEAFGVTALRVVSTDARQTIYEVEWLEFAGLGQDVTSTVPEVHWLDNERVIYTGCSGDWCGEAIINLFSGEIEVWSKEVRLMNIVSFSPDFRRAITSEYHADSFSFTFSLYDLTLDMPLGEFYQGRGLRSLAWMPEREQVVLSLLDGTTSDNSLRTFDYAGQMVEIMGFGEEIRALKPDFAQRRLAFTANGALHIADFETKMIQSLCLNFNYLLNDISAFNTGAWSPDDAYLAFSYQGEVAILNLATYEMEILQYTTGRVLGWYLL